MNLLYLTIILIGIITIIDQCTTINLRTATLFKNKQLNNYQYPTNGISSTNYTLERLNDNYYGAITYSPGNKMYFVFTHPLILALDRNGNTIHKLNIPKDGHPIQAAPYVEAGNLFYDLTQPTLQPITLKMIWAKDYPTKKGWTTMYSSYYDKASTVLYSRYGRDSNNKSARRAFLKVNNEWLCIILHRNISIQNDHQTLITNKQFPAKAERLQYLVDAKNKNASTHTKENLSELNQRFPQLTELNETYNNQNGVTTVFFEKTMVYEEIVYTPIPFLLGGTIYYHLKIDDDILQFKEHSYRSVLSWKPQNFARLYSVPKQFENQLKARFLVLEYPTNTNESGAAGMYVIKNKNN